MGSSFFRIKKHFANILIFISIFSTFSVRDFAQTNIVKPAGFVSNSKINQQQSDSAKTQSINNSFSFYICFQDGKDYSKSIKDFYSYKGYDVSGFLSFIGIGGDFEFNVVSNLFIYPGLSLIFQRISKTTTYAYLNNYTETKDEGTIIFSPEIGANYYLKFSRNLLYANVRLRYPLFVSPDGFDLSGNTISPSFGIGYRRIMTGTNSIGIEIGYSILPVTLKTNYPSINGDKDFGGLYINLVGAVAL